MLIGAKDGADTGPAQVADAPEEATNPSLVCLVSS